MAARVRTPLLAAAASAVAFVAVLTIAYGLPFASRADATARGGLVAVGGPRVTPIANFFASTADPLPVAALLAAIVALALVAGRRRRAVAAVALVAGASLTTEALKVAHPLGAGGFPSGHATGAMALALALVLVVRPRHRVPAMAGGAAYAIAVSLSILVLDWHFPSDVFGGMLVAAFYFCLVVAVLRAHAGREPGAGPPWARVAPRWWAAGAAAAALAAVLALARAGELAAYASAHTTATVIAVAVASCSAALVWGAGALADR